MKVFLVSFICLLLSIKLIDASCDQTSSDRSTWQNVKCSFRAGGKHLEEGWHTAVDGVKRGFDRIKDKVRGTNSMVQENNFDVRFGESQIGEQAAQVSNDQVLFPTENYEYYPIKATNGSHGNNSETLDDKSLFRVPRSCPEGQKLYNKVCRDIS